MKAYSFLTIMKIKEITTFPQTYLITSPTYYSQRKLKDTMNLTEAFMCHNDSYLSHVTMISLQPRGE